jgi:hypothetical protein
MRIEGGPQNASQQRSRSAFSSLASGGNSLTPLGVRMICQLAVHS